MRDGERLALIVDARGLPVPLPNQYGILILRPRSQASTLEDILRTIARIYDWAERRSISLPERFRSGNGLTPDELRALYQSFRYTADFSRRATRAVLNAVEISDIVDPKTQRRSVYRARDFLMWAMESTLYSIDVADVRYRAIRDRRYQISRISRQYLPSGTSCEVYGLSRPLRKRLLVITEPLYCNNPFQKRVRYRNWAAILLLLAFGYRRSEILKLYVADLNLRGSDPSIRLVRRPDDPNDPRKNEPRVKTLGRLLPLTKELAGILNEYVLYHRPQFPNAEKSPFLIMSVDGCPLSKRQVNHMMEQVRKIFPEFQNVLFPHALRHTSNDVLTQGVVLDLTHPLRQRAL